MKNKRYITLSDLGVAIGFMLLLTLTWLPIVVLIDVGRAILEKE